MAKHTTEVPETPEVTKETKTRKPKRSPLELIASQKQDHIDNILKLEKKIQDVTAELELAKKQQAAFIEHCRKEMGL